MTTQFQKHALTKAETDIIFSNHAAFRDFMDARFDYSYCVAIRTTPRLLRKYERVITPKAHADAAREFIASLAAE